MTNRMEPCHAWEGYVGNQTPEEFMVISRQQGQTTIEEAVAAYVSGATDIFARLTEEEKATAHYLLTAYIEEQLGELNQEDKLMLGQLTTRNEAGRHFYEVYDGAWLERMEAMGYITITRPVHGATGIAYSQEHHTVQVSPEVAAWFDSYGELLED